MLTTSEYFRVRLGALDEDTEKRVTEWAHSNLVASKVVREDGSVELLGRRSESKNSKALKMMIRALFQNWSIPLQINRGDWLELLTEDEFFFAQAMTTAGAEPLPEESEQSIEAKEKASEERAAQPRLRQPALPTLDEAGYPTHLSANFDKESTRLLQELIARGQICVACVA